MKAKKIFGQLHLYIGLSTGILFTIIALSGAIYTWQPEISEIIYHQKVKPSSKPFISVKDVTKVLKKEFPKGDLRTVMYRDQTRSIEVLLYGKGTYYHAYINPYTGEWIHLQDMKKGWLNKLRDLHRNLCLGDIGREIVHWVTLLSLVMIITGIVLWWPTTKRMRKYRFRIQTKSSPKKLNYDLHSVGGFYITWISIFTVATGLFWGFKVVKKTLKEVSGENKIQYDIPVSNPPLITENTDQFAIIDKLASKFLKACPSEYIRLKIPHHDAKEALQVSVIKPSMRESKTDHFYFDRYTGKALNGNFEHGLHQNNSTFHKINSLNYEVHFGTVLGLSGRLIAFIASLFASLLPITGFLIWYKSKNS